MKATCIRGLILVFKGVQLIFRGNISLHKVSVPLSVPVILSHRTGCLQSHMIIYTVASPWNALGSTECESSTVLTDPSPAQYHSIPQYTNSAIHTHTHSSNTLSWEWGEGEERDKGEEKSSGKGKKKREKRRKGGGIKKHCKYFLRGTVKKNSITCCWICHTLSKLERRSVLITATT